MNEQKRNYVKREEIEEVKRMRENALLKKQKKKNKKRKWWIALVMLTLLAVGVCGVLLYRDSLVYKVCHVEAGVAVSVTDFLKTADNSAYFSEESEPIDITVPGEYQLVIKTRFFKHPCTLYIEDTIAPAVVARPVQMEYGQTCDVMDFIQNIEDATNTTATFVKEPDYSLAELQKVQIAVTDAGNNTTIVESELMISKVVDFLNWEAGSAPPTISDFVLGGNEGRIVSDIESIDYTVLATHSVTVELDGKSYDIDMNIVDTVAPAFEVQDVEGFAVVARSAEEFVTGYEDITALTFSFETEPDLTAIGTQTVSVVATDEGGNRTIQEAQLTLIEDTEPPTIEGAKDIVVYLGDSVSYKSGVTARDNCPDGLALTVDSSKVNLSAAGIYPVEYTATDCAGNSISVSVTLTVKERVYDINEVNALADGVLARILTEGMSQYDKALAIFNYIKGHVGYISYSEKGDYVKAAYEGLVNGKGDCYVYASLSKVLLTRAGIPNMDIERIPEGDLMHYWNLVDIGDGWGWYHFDTTPRKDRPTIFLWNDTQITEYSKAHKNCHNYDRSLYPEIK